MLLKLYIYGYLNRVQSSRRLEREAGRNVEVMWLTGRLVPDHKTIADFRKDNGSGIRKVCTRVVELCRSLGLPAHASVAIDGSKFKAVNNRDRNFTTAKMKRRQAQIEESITRYLHQLDSADRQDPSPALAKRVSRLEEKIGKLKDEMARLEALDAERQTDGIDLRRYAAKECGNCMLKTRCTTSTRHVVTRWEHEHLAEEVQRRLDENPQAMRQRRETVEHPFGTIKMRMGATHFLMKRLKNVRTEMALSVLAYNLTRVMNILGPRLLLQAMRA